MVEVAEDASFRRVVATTPAPISEASDWTCRVLVGGVKASRTYWYRFTDAEGLGSRIGRTSTAPADNDPRPVSFAFVSCQNANDGAQNAHRRMIYEITPSFRTRRSVASAQTCPRRNALRRPCHR